MARAPSSKSDSFFQLKGDTSEFDQEKFFEHLSSSNHMRGVIYKPDKLSRPFANRIHRIKGVEFENVSFTRTNISNIIFTDCIFRDCLFISAKIEECEFHNCRFHNTNTHKIYFIKTYINPKSFKNCLDRNKHQNIGVHLFQNLMSDSRDQDQPEFEAIARFLFHRWKRYQDIYYLKKNFKDEISIWKKLEFRLLYKITRSFFWEKLFGSGIKSSYLFKTALSCVAIVTTINYKFRREFGLDTGSFPVETVIDSFYFSMITLTTLGFGDITPTTELGRAIVAIEGAFGLVLFALFASMMFRKMAP